MQRCRACRSFTPGSGGWELDWHPVPLLELALFRRSRAQESAIGLRYETSALAPYLAMDLVDASFPARDVRLGREQLTGISRRPVAHVHLRGHRPGVIAGRSPRHHLVEERGQDAAVDLVLPPDIVSTRQPFGAGHPIAELDLQAHADNVLATAREAVVIGEGVAPAIPTLDDSAGSVVLPRSWARPWRAPGSGAHQASSSSSSQPRPSSSSRLRRRQ